MKHAIVGWMAVVAVALVASAPARAATLAGSRPNIILVMTDDQGYGDLACHGNPLIQTPHLDRLFAQSVRFTDFQVSPTCSPTRASLLTGRHEFKSGVTHTILERERLSPAATTLASVLKSAGYATGIFGKWHLGDEPAYRPNQRGFDEVYIHGAGGIGQTYPGSCGDAPDNKYFDPALLHNGRFEMTKGYCTDLFFAQALAWIAERGQGRAPFFAYITPNCPHSPHVSPGPQYDKLYSGKSIEGKRLDKEAVAYYSMITNIDDNVGKLISKIAELGIENNTLVIFMTDNGGTHTRLFSAGMRAGKASPYQGGTRVPSFWRWPGRLAAGVDVKALTAHVDYFPTFVELAGAKIPAEVKLDGRSLLPLLADPQAAWPDRYVFVHLGRWPKGQAEEWKFQNCAVRNGRYRFVNNLELYDLESDPGETTNVIDGHPQVVAEMRNAYDAWWSEARRGMVNEDAVGPKINPMKALYWEQFGGG
ncbi:MAG: arylsulfatase, partial [Pirellulales bacterium]